MSTQAQVKNVYVNTVVCPVMTHTLRVTSEPVGRISLTGGEYFQARAVNEASAHECTLTLSAAWRLRKGKYYRFTVDALGLVTKVTKRNGHRVNIYPPFPQSH
jgi:hypothetical protein